MCRAVPESVFSFGVFPLEEFHGSVGGDGACQIPLFAVDSGGKHFACETAGNALSDLEGRNTRFKFLDAIIGKSD